MFVSRKKYIKALLEVDKYKKEAMEAKKEAVSKNIEINGLNIKLKNLEEDRKYLQAENSDLKVKLHNTEPNDDNSEEKVKELEAKVKELEFTLKEYQRVNTTLKNKVDIADISKKQIEKLLNPIEYTNRITSQKSTLVNKNVDGQKLYKIIQALS